VTADTYVIKAELPEVAKKDINVSVRDGVITIRGERRLENQSTDEKHHRIESFFFARRFAGGDLTESGNQSPLRRPAP